MARGYESIGTKWERWRIKRLKHGQNGHLGQRLAQARRHAEARARREHQAAIEAARIAERAEEESPRPQAGNYALGARPIATQLAERDAASNAVRSLTSLMLGDPAPGRSALDRMIAAASYTRVTAPQEPADAPLS